jgi:hypothetical protein
LVLFPINISKLPEVTVSDRLVQQVETAPPVAQQSLQRSTTGTTDIGLR